MMKILTPKDQIECARVYVNSHERSKLTLKCFFCGREFLHWTRFVAHIEMRHSDLERAYTRAKDAWIQFESGQTPTAGESEVEFLTEEAEYVEEDQQEQCLENVIQQQQNDTMQHETELVLIPDELNMDQKAIVEEYVGTLEELTNDVIYIEESEEGKEQVFLEAKRQQPFVEFQVEEITEENEQLATINYQLHDFDSAATVDSVSKDMPGYSRKKSTLKDVQQRVKNDGVNTLQAQAECSETVANKRAKAIKNVSQKHIKSNSKSVEPATHDKMHAGSHYFRLRRTDPSVMFAFIEIMRRHPCQWNPQHPDYEIKDRRDESAEKICNELQTRFNLYLDPQNVRNSVCYLRRWYEREYLKNVESSETKNITCAHPEYYAKLSEFLPHEHLGIRHCDKCPRKFRSEQQLQSHIYHNHDGELPYQCGYCSRKFLYQSMLRHHENRHTKERTFQCKLCDYSCATKTDYSIHMVMHTDIRSYVCDLCGAAYKSSASLNVHKRSHSAPRLACELCGKKFYENYRYKQHMWQHEGDTEAEALLAAQEMELMAETSMEMGEKYKEEPAGNIQNEAYLESNSNHNPVEDNSTDDDAEVSGCTICERHFDNANALRTHGLREHQVFFF